MPTDYYHTYITPEGFDDIILRSDGTALTGLYFAHHHDRNTHSSSEAELPVFRDTRLWLDIYFSGKQPDFTPAYRIDNLTPFRQRVQQIMQSIPFGQMMTYGEIAKAIDDCTDSAAKMSAQAVGGAVGWNPICIIVPCHRVIGARGQLVGYGGGINNKINLLGLEGHSISKSLIVT
ncbi:MAG: methylated-DNA--[Paludibacteraceae bacterium]|nr:methylated-DNA--[protein]-cysteine S-methyltransferase [Paludibacteraceae bacterium]